MEQQSDQHLIERTLDGDQTAFALLVERYGGDVYARVSRTIRYPRGSTSIQADGLSLPMDIGYFSGPQRI